MTIRKPPGVSWESFVERQIREAQERGEFDGLPGDGKPIPDLDDPPDEMRWIKSKLRREGVSILPPALQLLKACEGARDRIARMRSETEVRAFVAELNRQILHANRLGTTGPPTTLLPFDVDEEVASWQATSNARE